MKRSLLWVLLLATLALPMPSLAETVTFSVTTDATPSSVLLMDDFGNSLSTVLGSQSINDQIIWTLRVTDNGASAALLYTKDDNGNWVNTNIVYPMSWIFTGVTQSDGDTSVPGASSDDTAWPQKIYRLWSVSAYSLPEDQRVQSRCGPAKTYHGAGAYKTYKMTSTKALFIEGSYMLVDLDYTTVGRRRVYFPVSAFSGTQNVPEASLSGIPAYVTNNLIPTFGPGMEYDTFDEAVIDSGTTL
ncbi:MAG: hypothetical protein LLF96_07865, partial [Eubacteriales bacterium]|nr:hypothetical protein [Eubacteriales bacterium]